MDLFAIEDWPPKMGGTWQIQGRAEIKGIEVLLGGQLQIHHGGKHFGFELDLKIRKGFVKIMGLRYREAYFHDGKRLVAIECRLSPKIHIPIIPLNFIEKIEVKTIHDRQFVKHSRAAKSLENLSSFNWNEADNCKPPMGVYFILPHIEKIAFRQIGTFQYSREKGRFTFEREDMKIRFDNGNYTVSGDYDYGSAEIDFVKV